MGSGLMNLTRRAVFLDRDGVLNRALLRDGKPYPPSTEAEFEIFPEASECLDRLKKLRLKLIVVTNQPDVGRGTQDVAMVDRFHAKLAEALPLDDILTCLHDNASNCSCRKPKPGLLTEAAARHGLALRNCFMIGDRWRDVDAGASAGSRTIWIDRGYSEAPPVHTPDARVATLEQAVAWIENFLENEDPLKSLCVKLFADGAEKKGILEMYGNASIQGFTTNPTLMRKAGITDYEAFARDIVSHIPDRPISFEVFADDFDQMDRQARKVAGWGPNVYVKIPVTNTRGESSAPLIRRLSASGIKLNVTALLTSDQVRTVADALELGVPSYISVFAGRIADTGRDPIPVMVEALEIMSSKPNIELIWASPRELLNIFQADAIGCHIITATSDVLKKLFLVGKDLDEYSLETVKMFYDDALKANYEL
jgi:transaldolase